MVLRQKSVRSMQRPIAFSRGNDMPSTSAKQHRFMEAVAHNPKFAKAAGVPQKVGKDFARADKAAGMDKNPTPKARKK